MKTVSYEIRYGLFDTFKTFVTEDYEQALRVYEKYKIFAEIHELTWVVSLYEKLENNKYWLIKSETINPTKEIRI